MKAIHVQIDELKRAIKAAENKKAHADTSILIIAENGEIRLQCAYAECYDSYICTIPVKSYRYTFA